MPYYDGSGTEEGNPNFYTLYHQLLSLLFSYKAIEKAMGDIVVKLPLPPGTLTTLFRGINNYEQFENNAESSLDEAKFHEVYLKPHPGYYLSGMNWIQ